MKKGIALVLILAVSFGFSACSAMEKKRGKDEPEEVTLSFMLPQTHYKDFLKDSISRFEQEYPHIHIDPLVIPDNQWIDLVKRKVSVGETPDIIRIDTTLVTDVGTQHFYEFDSSAPWYSRAIPEQIESKLIDGRLYGLPIGSESSVGIVYNRQLFEENGIEIPNNYEEMAEACKAFKAKGITPLYASDKDSWTVQISFSAAATQTVSPSVWSNLRSGKLKWNEVEEFETILEDFLALRTNGYTNDDYLEATYASAVAAMADGAAAMYIIGQFFVNDVLAQNPEMDLVMAPVPYSKDLLTVIPGPGMFSVFNSTPNLEEALLFLDWFSQPDNMDAFIGGWGHMPLYIDQKLVLPPWQKYLMDEYVYAGKTVLNINEMYAGISFQNFWDLQQEMMAGLLSPQEVLNEWETDFAGQVRH